MAFHSRVSFSPSHNAAAFVETDQLALADQLLMCHSERRHWRHVVSMLAKRAQSFAAQRLVSSLLVVLTVSVAASWWVG